MTIARRSTNYSDAELEILDKLHDNYPGNELVERYQAIAKERGLPHRSKWSIKKKIWYSYGSIRPRHQNFCARELCRILGFDERRAYKWIYSKRLKAHKCGKDYKITRKALYDFAQKHPRLLRDADRDRLLFLFDEKTVDKIKSSQPLQRHGVPVIHKITGEYFKTTKSASLAYGIPESTIRGQISRGDGVWRRPNKNNKGGQKSA